MTKGCSSVGERVRVAKLLVTGGLEIEAGHGWLFVIGKKTMSREPREEGSGFPALRSYNLLSHLYTNKWEVDSIDINRIDLPLIGI